MSHFGIDFVASPRHSDGIVITGPISENMAEPTERCYNAIPNPKIISLQESMPLAAVSLLTVWQ